MGWISVTVSVKHVTPTILNVLQVTVNGLVQTRGADTLSSQVGLVPTITVNAQATSNTVNIAVVNLLEFRSSAALTAKRLKMPSAD